MIFDDANLVMVSIMSHLDTINWVQHVGHIYAAFGKCVYDKSRRGFHVIVSNCRRFNTKFNWCVSCFRQCEVLKAKIQGMSFFMSY